MRKNVFGRQLKRDTNERKALFKGLASSLVIYERIQTTEEKAKAVRPLVEKLVTKARVGDSHAHSLLQPYLNAQALKKMLADIGPRFKDRPGGYTRIIKMGPRLQDNASVVILEWVEKPTIKAVVPAKKGTKSSKATQAKTEKVEAKAALGKGTKKKTVKKEAKSK
jgi:large subunit ribosomal protein L17